MSDATLAFFITAQIPISRRFFDKCAKPVLPHESSCFPAKKSSVALGKGAEFWEFHLSGEVNLLYCLVPSRTSRSKVWFMNLSRSSLLARSTLANSSWARFKSPFLR